MTTTGGVFGRFAASNAVGEHDSAAGSSGGCDKTAGSRTQHRAAMARMRTPPSGSVRWPRRSGAIEADQVSRTGGTARVAPRVDEGAAQVDRLRQLAAPFLVCERLGADDPIRAGLESYLESWSARGGLHRKQLEDELDRAIRAKQANTALLWVLALAGRVLIEGHPIGLRMIGSRDWKLDPAKNGFRAALEGAAGDQARHDSFDAHIARDAAVTVAEVLRLLPARPGF